MKPVYKTETDSTSSLPAFTSLSESLNGSSGLMLMTCLSVIVLLALLNPSSKPKLATARWASGREKHHANRRAKQQFEEQKFNKVSLTTGIPGHSNGQHLPDCQRGLSFVGAPGVGKSYALEPYVVSALVQGFPVIVYDFKYPSQTRKLAYIALQFGYRVGIFAPGYDTSDVCNPLDFADDAQDLTKLRGLAKVFNRNAGNSGFRMRNDFFDKSGDNLTAGCLSVAKGSDYPDLAMAQAVLRLPDLANRLRHADTLPAFTRMAFEQLISLTESEKTVASIIGTAQGNCNQFMAPSLLKALVGRTTMPLDLHGKQLIILGMDKERREAVAPLLASVLHLLVTRNVSKPRQTPLVVSIDELPTLYLPDLVHWINEYREQGLCLLLGYQNLAQMEKSYGREASKAIFGACATKIMFNPGEPESARLFSDYLGDEEICYTETSRSRGGGRTSTSKQPQRRTRKLLTPDSFLRLPPGNAVVISPGVANKHQSSIPFKTRIKVSPRIVKLLATSESAWKRLQPMLAKRNAQQLVDEAALQARLDLATMHIPPLPGDNEQF